MRNRTLAAYLAEFIGTTLLVLFIALIVTVQTPAGVGQPRDFAVVGLEHAFVLMMLVTTLGAASGAHFNPAITIALAAIRKISPRDAAVYIALQIAGAIAGAAIVLWLLHDLGTASNLGAPAPSELIKHAAFTSSLCELIGTFVLVWAVMGVAVNPRGERHWAGFVIGATLGFAVMAFAPITGAGLNPARSLGPAIVANAWATGAGKFIVIYVVAPIIGGLLASLGYVIFVLEPEDRVGVRPIDKLA